MTGTDGIMWRESGHGMAHPLGWSLQKHWLLGTGARTGAGFFPVGCRGVDSRACTAALAPMQVGKPAAGRFRSG